MPPRLARLLAAVVAVALVAGAFALRGALADDDGSGTGSTGEGGDPADGEAYRILCDADLGDDVCAAVEEATGADVEVVAAGEVLAAEEPPSADAWLTLDPMPAVLDAARELAGAPPVTAGAPVEVASSRLALLERQDLGCDGEWDCILDASADRPIGVPEPDTAPGVIAIGAALLAVAPDQTRGIATLDDGDNRSRLEDLLDSGDPLPLDDQMQAFLTQVGRYRAIITTEGLARDAEAGPRGDGLQVLVLEPATTVGVVLAGMGPRGDAAVRALEPAVTGQTVADALSEAGWDGGAGSTTGLPAPDVIYGLRERLR